MPQSVIGPTIVGPYRHSHLARDARSIALWEQVGYNGTDVVSFLTYQDETISNKANIALDLRIKWVRQ
jgi:hypothetical protein